MHRESFAMDLLKYGGGYVRCRSYWNGDGRVLSETSARGGWGEIKFQFEK